jgi:hypothetical protein
VVVVATVRHDPLRIRFALDDPDGVIALAAFLGQVGRFQQDRNRSLMSPSLTHATGDDVRLELLVQRRVQGEVMVVKMMFQRSERRSTGLGQRGRGRGGSSGFEGVFGDGLAGLDGLEDAGLGRVVAAEE